MAKLFGIGVGPGDPELMTLKAVRIIKECDVIAVPGIDWKSSIAYRIAREVVSELDDKEIIGIHMPMTKEKERLEESHKKGADILITYLEQGKQVGFLTLGDITVYSTYLYLYKNVEYRGYQTEMVSGIPSFCAAAARLNQGLVEKEQPLHVIPASYQIEDALKLPGTKVLMKAGKQMGIVKKQLIRLGLEAIMIENCGMKNEKIVLAAEDIEESAGYYSLIIAKERKEK